MKKNKNNFFWISYSDLMTSLFFIMLLLFSVSTIGLYQNNKATKEQLQSIKDMQTAVSQLDSTYFVEDSIHKRWILRQQIHFETGKAILPEESKPYLDKVGASLRQVISNLNDSIKLERYKGMDVTFLVVIEGMASKDGWPHNDDLSYARALSLYNYWKGSIFDRPENKKMLEVQIAGSGERGIRPFPDDPVNTEKNQTIILQIIPKIRYRK